MYEVSAMIVIADTPSVRRLVYSGALESLPSRVMGYADDRSHCLWSLT